MRTCKQRARSGRRTAIVVALLLAVTLVIGANTPWRQALPDYAWNFPDDHWAHREHRIEWWYLTGHLHDPDDPGRSFGYQFTIFRVRLASPEQEASWPDPSSEWRTSQLFIGHAAVSDVNRKRHLQDQIMARGALGLAGHAEQPLLAVVVDESGSAVLVVRSQRLEHVGVIETHREELRRVRRHHDLFDVTADRIHLDDPRHAQCLLLQPHGPVGVPELNLGVVLEILEHLLQGELERGPHADDGDKDRSRQRQRRQRQHCRRN